LEYFESYGLAVLKKYWKIENVQSLFSTAEELHKIKGIKCHNKVEIVMLMSTCKIQ